MTASPSPPAQGERKAGRAAGRPHRRADLAIGIVLGIVIGLCAVSAFVFLGSEGTLDAPQVPQSREASPRNAQPAHHGDARPAPRPSGASARP